MCRGLAQPFFLILLTRVPCPCLLVFGEIGPAFAKNAQGRAFSAGAHVGTIPARSLFAPSTPTRSPIYSEACGILSGSRQSCAETSPAWSQPKRVISDPAIAEIAAHLRKSRACSPLLRKLITRNPSDTGPDSTPPTRTTAPLAPLLSGSRHASRWVSMRNSSMHPKIAAPHPCHCSARPCPRPVG